MPFTVYKDAVESGSLPVTTPTAPKPSWGNLFETPLAASTPTGAPVGPPTEIVVSGPNAGESGLTDETDEYYSANDFAPIQCDDPNDTTITPLILVRAPISSARQEGANPPPGLEGVVPLVPPSAAIEGAEGTAISDGMPRQTDSSTTSGSLQIDEDTEGEDQEFPLDDTLVNEDPPANPNPPMEDNVAPLEESSARTVPPRLPSAAGSAISSASPAEVTSGLSSVSPASSAAGPPTDPATTGPSPTGETDTSGPTSIAEGLTHLEEAPSDQLHGAPHVPPALRPTSRQPTVQSLMIPLRSGDVVMVPRTLQKRKPVAEAVPAAEYEYDSTAADLVLRRPQMFNVGPETYSGLARAQAVVMQTLSTQAKFHFPGWPAYQQMTHREWLTDVRERLLMNHNTKAE